MTSWFDRSLCKGKSPDLWFPPIESPNISQFYAVGRMVCDRCPVWEECLDYGKDEVFGMWGGLSPKERPIGGTAVQVLKLHGTIGRFRQGCNCEECSEAAFAPLPKLPLDLIPSDRSGEVVIQEVIKTLSSVSKLSN